MQTTIVTIPLDTETARLYNNAFEEEKRKIEFLLELFFRDFIASPRLLKEIMDEIGNKTEERGLTPEILDSILNDEHLDTARDIIERVLGFRPKEIRQHTEFAVG